MSTCAAQTAKRCHLRYATIYMFPPSLLLLLGEAFFNSRTDEFPFLAGLPLAASAILGIHVIRRQDLSENSLFAHGRIKLMDKATLMAFDVMLGSVLLLMAFASWFVLQVDKETYQGLGRLSTVPLIVGFCIHYFLAFAAMEEGFLTGQCRECVHCHDLNSFAALEAQYMDDDDDSYLPASHDSSVSCEKRPLPQIHTEILNEKAAPQPWMAINQLGNE